MAVLDLHCCTQSFFSLSEQELIISSCHARASNCTGFSRCGAQTLGAWTSLLRGMWNLPGPWTWAQTRVPCIGRWILNLNHQRSPVTWLSGCTGAVGARPARPELIRSSTLSFRKVLGWQTQWCSCSQNMRCPETTEKRGRYDHRNKYHHIGLSHTLSHLIYSLYQLHKVFTLILNEILETIDYRD